MAVQTVNVEFFFASGCSHCAESRGAAESVPSVEPRSSELQAAIEARQREF